MSHRRGPDEFCSDTKAKNGAKAATVIRIDEATAQLRALERKIGRVEGSICILRMAEGDILISIKRTVGHGRWQSFLNDCGITVRDAQIAMQLAKARSQIEAANTKTSSLLSIAAALRLIRSEKTTTAKATEPIENPYSVEALKKLSAADRARILAGLGITRADVPAHIAADIVRHAVDQERSSAKLHQSDLWHVVDGVRVALATAESAERKIEHIESVIAKLVPPPDWITRLHPSSHFYFPKDKKPETATMADDSALSSIGAALH
jgi:hypothetical protein